MSQSLFISCLINFSFNYFYLCPHNVCTTILLLHLASRLLFFFFKLCLHNLCSSISFVSAPSFTTVHWLLSALPLVTAQLPALNCNQSQHWCRSERELQTPLVCICKWIICFRDMKIRLEMPAGDLWLFEVIRWHQSTHEWAVLPSFL